MLKFAKKDKMQKNGVYRLYSLTCIAAYDSLPSDLDELTDYKLQKPELRKDEETDHHSFLHWISAQKCKICLAKCIFKTSCISLMPVSWWNTAPLYGFHLT